MDDQQTFSGRSANSRQKQTITTSINNFLGDQSIRDLGWTWDRIAANRIPGSTIDQMHRSASIYLSSLVRQPPFMSIRAANSIPQNAVFLVDETGRLYYSWPNVSSAGEHTTDWFSRIDITDHFSGIATFNEDMTLLAKMAKLSGGWVVTGDKIVVSQWLRLHQLPLPANEQSARELLELIDFATLPDAPRFSNYWQLLDTPEDSPFNLTEHKRAIIRQVTETFKGGYLTLVDAFGEHLRLESTSADKLPTSLAYRLPRLIEIAAWSSNQGQAYLDALGWFTDASGPRASPEFIEQLLIAAMLLDLDPEANGAGTTFAGFDLYSPSYVQAQPSQVGTDLQTHLAERFKLDTLLAPLIAEMVLAGLAPQYLVRDVPSTLCLGTPGWVVLTQAVNLAENLVAGSSRVMTYEHLLRFSPASDLTPQFQSLHADLNVDPVLTWALMNGVVRRNADGSLDQEAVNQAIQHYNQYSDMLAKALRDINEPIPRRKALALKEFQARVPDCDPQELLVKHRGSRTGGGAKVSVLDLYMSDQLHTQDWGRIRGADIYQSFPGLTELYPVSGLYESAIHNHYNRVKEAFSIHIRFIFAQMEQSNRRFIEHGRLGIYRVEQYQSHVGKGIPQASPARTARYGLILCAELGASLVRCFELFPLQSLCRDSPELRDDVGQHLFSYYEGSTTRADFVHDNGLVNAPLDSDAYFQNSAPREGQTSTVFVRKIGEFDAAFHASQSASPVRYFHSERVKAISDLIAREHLFVTEAEMANIGRDSTEQELSAQKFDVIFNTILNLIIPFKECIEQLSSGVPEKQRDAIASCVMDATFIAVAFVGAPGKVIATAGKGASVVTKLLAASRIGARTVASILNPLDGVPTLLKGGAKLISKGARTLRTHVIAQLHHLTGANSYDLIRALNHTGAASQIRMGLDSVAHARALFKDDSITTIEQVVTRLSDKKLPKGASPEELQHLFDSSIREAALQSKQAQNLGALIGEPALGDVLASYLASMPIIRYTDEYHTAQRLTETLATVAELEAKKAIYLTNHQQNLLKLDLGKGPYHSVLPESAFNPNGFTDPVQRAGAWMANGAVSQTNDYENFVAVLREYAANNKSLTDPAVIAEVHSRLVPAVSGRVRVAGQPTQYGSSITGFALLEQHLKILDSAHQHVDKHLLAAVIGFQSFADGNGRTASAMYAISQLRSGGFTPLSREAVDVLSGIR